MPAARSTQGATVAAIDTPWMHVACRELGVREIPGARDNPRILEYATAVDYHPAHDEDAWCSNFANWVMQQAGYKGTRKANARSWLTWGDKLEKPQYGCVIVFWRDEVQSAKGHVAFYLRDSGINDLIVLGGNQLNSVCAMPYPRTRLLGCRWPVVG